MKEKRKKRLVDVLEILLYLLLELGLAYVLVSELNLDPGFIPIAGAVFVYLGKLIVVRIKDANSN